MMQNKTWKKQKNRIWNVGKCRHCDKELVNTDTFVCFADKSRACLKCYHNSGASLPMFRK